MNRTRFLAISAIWLIHFNLGLPAEAGIRDAVHCVVDGIERSLPDRSQSVPTFIQPVTMRAEIFFARLRARFERLPDSERDYSRAKTAARVSKGKNFDLISMLPEEARKDELDVWHRLVPSLKDHQVVIKPDGSLRNAKGELLDGDFNFVMDDRGDFYVSTSRFALVLRRYHSDLLGKTSVAAAGQISVRKGSLFMIDDKSGHFSPPWQFLFQALSRLSKLGVNTRDTSIRFYEPPKGAQMKFGESP